MNLILNSVAAEEEKRADNTIGELKTKVSLDSGSDDVILSEENGNPKTMTLLCVPYNTPGPYWGGALEYKSGCFSEWLASDKNATIRASAHDNNPFYNLGSRSVGDAEGGATFWEDSRGLWAKVNLFQDDEVSKNAYKRVKAGTISTCSVGTIENEYVIAGEGDGRITSITRCDAIETSLVSAGTERFAETEVTVSDVATGDEDNTISDMTEKEVFPFNMTIDEFNSALQSAMTETVEKYKAEIQRETTVKTSSGGTNEDSTEGEEEVETSEKPDVFLRLLGGNQNVKGKHAS